VRTRACCWPARIAYYALLSIVPLLILIVIVLTHWVDQAELLRTLGRYLEWLVPGQSAAIVHELANFLAHRDVMGWVLGATLLFFSSLAFTVLENAMSVIFVHRVAIKRRHFLVSALLPYLYILVSGHRAAVGDAGRRQPASHRAGGGRVLGWHWSLRGVSGAPLYLLGFTGEVFVLTSVYMVMPVGRPAIATR
jgi:hypothetical protein